ncbi:MAG TPA: hypothetical protein VNO20_00595 [Solirubrobacterales bacterium]|nr:hypothetical protein [Solirubrobacterales bacterium]
MLTGVWSVNGELGEEEAGADGTIPLQAAISFLSKVEPAPELVYLSGPTSPSGGVILVFDTETGKVTDMRESPSESGDFCGSGTISNPQANPGYICVFAETEKNVFPVDFFALLEAFLEEEEAQSNAWISPAPQSGAIAPLTLINPSTGNPAPGGYAKGSWALNTE